MALAIASLTTLSGDELTSPTITAPTGIAVGDLLLAVVHRSATIASASDFPTITGFTKDYFFNGVNVSDEQHSISVLYKVAEAADTSASTYTINFGTSQGGAATLYRISGWNGNTAAPVFDNESFTARTSTTVGTFSFSVDIPRIAQGLCFIVGARRVEDNLVGPMNHSNYAITSTEGSLTFTEDIDALSEVNNSHALFSVARAASTANSNITNFSYSYNRGSSLTESGGSQISSIFFIAEPQDATGNAALYQTNAVFFPNASVLGATGTSSFPQHNAYFGDAQVTVISRTNWVNEARVTTTWTNEQI